MRRVLIISTVAFALLGTEVAAAAFRSGFYSGRTEFGGPVSLSISQSRLSNFRIGVVFTCTDGDRFQSPVLRGFPAQDITKRVVRRLTRGYYSASFTGSRGASRYTHSGNVVNRTVRGTFTGRRTYNEDDQLDPAGRVICRTGTVHYTIRKP